jgi:hypothetical protein
MKRILWIAPYLGLLLAGCNTTILVASGKEFSDYQKSIKPYLAYWQKEGMTEEGRRVDSAACGASQAPAVVNDVMFPSEVLKAERRQGDTNELAAFWRLREKWSRCMEAKGYRYVK